MPTASPDARPTLLTGPWADIDWAAPLPDDFVLPDHHYRPAPAALLTREQRVRLNRLEVCFSCEQAVHFERFLIAYIERNRHQLRACNDRQWTRFVAEERAHVEAFARVLSMLRPDLYGPEASLRFLPWARSDDALLALAPPVAFFLLAALFEEITLFLPEVMDERPEQSFGPLYQVMRLHRDEERLHVALDARVLREARDRLPRGWVAAEVLLTLPLLAYCDRKIRAAWVTALDLFAAEEGLSTAQRDSLRDRGNARSDVLGTASFVTKLQALALPGGDVLGRVLSWQVR